MNLATDSTNLVAINPVGQVGSEGEEKCESVFPNIARSPKGKWKRKKAKAVRLDQNPVASLLYYSEISVTTSVTTSERDIDMAMAVFNELAIENYGRL